MKTVLTAPLVGLVMALARAAPVAAASTGSAGTAATSQPPQTYVVTTIAQTAAGRLAIRETLSLTSDGERNRLSIANASDGGIVSVPITYVRGRDRYEFARQCGHLL